MDFLDVGRTAASGNVCTAPIPNVHLADGQMCSYLHKEHFQVLGNANTSHQVEDLNPPQVTFTLKAQQVQHCCISQPGQQTAIYFRLLMARTQSRAQVHNSGSQLSDSTLPTATQTACRLPRSFLSPAHLEAPMLPWGSAPTWPLPHHTFGLFPLTALGNWNEKHIFIYGTDISFLHPLHPTKPCRAISVTH